MSAVRIAQPGGRVSGAGTIMLPSPWLDDDDAPAVTATCRKPRVLVATDGSYASRGALKLAALLAERDGATVHVATVLERWGPPAPVHDFVATEYTEMVGEQLTHRLSNVLPRAQAAFGGTRRWRLRVMDGGVVPSIAAAADEEYDLILVGLRRRWRDRLLRRPTALGIARHASVPVLAVPPSVTALPARAVVAAHDGPAATVAARAATNLVHSPDGVQLVRVLGDGDGGDPARRLLAHARTTGADLIALGAHRAASLRDRLLGGVGRRVLDAAECCVLLAGPRVGERRLRPVAAPG